jgi:hypothetical protein
MLFIYGNSTRNQQKHMISECAVCYVADTNFTLPTLVFATGLRKFVPAEKAPVYVFLIDDDARVPELSRFLAPYDIRVASRAAAPTSFSIPTNSTDPTSRQWRSAVSLSKACYPTRRRIVYPDCDT